MIQELYFSMPTVFQLHEIEKACFGKDAWSINNLVSEYRNEYSHIYGEVVDGKVIAYVCVRTIYEEAQICNIAVMPDYRRKGIATRLLETVAEVAKQQGCERCELEVNVENIPAVELYKKCGYEIAGTRVNFYRRTRYASRDAFTMLKRL
ncbi:MAG: ribosomal protein S18-alanine N-acetyltransferase [Clostridiales bacterium]|nr:ribosomal protein S18-alanine N-acetyltransferase [Clostridiales bacterium]